MGFEPGLISGVTVQSEETVARDYAWSTPWEVTPSTPDHVDIRADDVPDGINAADHAAGLSSSLDNLAASVER